MSNPGWYPDPSGRPGHFRFWDGRLWSEQTTTNPAAQPNGPGALAGLSRPGVPGMSGTSGTPGKPGMPRWLIALLAGVVAVITIFAYRAWSNRETIVVVDPVPPSSTSPATPTSSPTDVASDPSVDLCMSGNQQAMPKGTGGVVSNSGLELRAPADWGFRLDKDQWTWLDDVWSYGKNKPGERALTVGRLPQQLPSGAVGVEQQWLCWTTYGFLKEAGVPNELPTAAKAVTVGGLKGHESSFETSTSDGKVIIRIGVYETEGARVAVMGYYDAAAGAEAKKQVDDAFSSITGG